ncbi:serine hydrolase [Mycobacterium kubicae]|uniref:Serine hydrolase n=1 Tax=Mycobacterium kubicae TaxID=120959 RepID=A0AAX1J9G0_9MYCO|nr:serine hydrolase [Mycobacterium kubicae]MCV7097733.1 serine hydrolase [Mycobacterium kubicae]ORV94423.1 serine hydrolase [Mycobacterium kubicae]QNI13544.1 serine hydrolase [Mycobacterium kubicae]QPI37061.1 serine hydrolase [Mycobacterium kubicae]GFG66871.1 serine hydrolase [Mycobacterium kubicae]
MTKRAAKAATAALVLALAACGPARPVANPPTSSAKLPPGEVSAVDIPASRIDDAIGKVDGLVADLMKTSGIPGMAVAIVHGGKTVYARGFGVKDVTKGDNADNKVNPDTVFQLASVSKSVGATVIAHQVTDHAITWDTPVVDKLPWFALSDPYVGTHVTVADLYSHRSGLPDHAGDPLEDLGYDRRQVLDRLKQLPLAPFRITYAYTNFGVTAAAEAVAAAAGKSWEDLSDEVLYRPLGMTSTSSKFADFIARPDHAVNHVKVGDKWEARFQRDPDAQSPAGGVSSSINDMARWLTMVLANGTYNGQRIAAPEALLPAYTPQIVSSPPTSPKDRPVFYGHGFNVSVTSSGRTQYSHSGAFGLGAATNFVALPSEDLAIIALTNAAPIGVPETLTAEFMDLVQYGQVREDWAALYRNAFAPMNAPEGSLVGKQPPANPAPPRPLADYVGVYANDYWGPATVTERDGRLQLTLGPKNRTFDLTHWDGDTFTFGLSSENAPPGTISKATFSGATLNLGYYDDNKLGTFTR